MSGNLIGQKGRSRLFYGWLILPAAVVTMFLFQSSRMSLSVAYPVILDEFGWSRGSTALIFSIFMVFRGLSDLTIGPLVDRYGPRRVILLSIPILGLAMVLASFSSQLWQLYLTLGALAAIGLSGAGFLPQATMLSQWFVQRKGMALGILVAGASLAFLIGPPFQYFISLFSWRGAYLILASLVVGLGLSLALVFFRSPPQETELLPDDPAPTSKTGAPESDSHGLLRGWRKTLAGVTKNPRFWALYGTFLIWNLGCWGLIMTHVVVFFKDLGYSEMFAASMFGLFGLVRPLGSASSFISDRIGRKKVFALGNLGAVLGMIFLLLVRDTSNPWMVYGFVILFGLGTGLSGPTMPTMTADIYKENFGTILGFAMTAVALGTAIGSWLGGFIYDLTKSYDLAFWLVLSTMLLSVALFWLAAPRRVVAVRRAEH